MRRLVPVLFLLAAVAVGFVTWPDRSSSDLSSFQLHPDFEMTRVAAEPLVFDPVDLAFDERGRAFVVEMPGYPNPEEASRVVLLKDTDSDGVYDERTVFAEDLSIASSLLPYRGGFLVAAPPGLVFVKDTDGDDVADHREVVLEGFSLGNQQHNYNGLVYGVDNWIYAANGGNSGNIYWPDDPENKTLLRGQDFRFKLEAKQFERIGRSSGGHGLALDDAGRIFETHNLEHVSHLVFHGRYVEGLPVTPAHTLDNISDHEENGLARIFPIGIQETRVNHPEQSGYFSGACGIMYYGGGAFPEAFNGNLFVGDVVLNLIHRDVLTPDGATFAAARARPRVEFLASSDRAFRPVRMTVGPDGALYVMDMHRDVIEHPEWIPDEIEATLDLDAGKDKGRIYRITPKGGLPWVAPSFDASDLDAVVAALAHPNKWWRDTAQRLLVMWQDDGAVAPLQALLADAEEGVARLHALWTLEGLGHLDEPTLLAALADADARVREQAVILAEASLDAHPERHAALLALADDPAPRVRMQAALTLGTLQDDPPDGFDAALLTIARRDAADPWVRLALVSSAQQDPLPMLAALLADDALTDTEGGEALVSMLAKVAGQGRDMRLLADALAAMETAAPGPGAVTATLEGLAAGWARYPGAVAHADDARKVEAALAPWSRSTSPAVLRATWALHAAVRLEAPANQPPVVARAMQVAADAGASLDQRLAHLSLVAFAPFADRAALLYGLLDPHQPPALQRAAMAQLADARDPAVADALIARWPQLSPQARQAATDILLYQRANHDRLLTALETGTVRLGEMNLHLERRRTLLFSNDPAIRARAEALFSDAGVVTRKEALAQMRPALALAGDPEGGRPVYQAACASCHRLGDEGVAVGPNLTEIFRKSAETLLHDIVDPNAAVETRYIGHTLHTHDGQVLVGIVEHETDQEVTLRAAGGIDQTVARPAIKALQATGLSLMPEGLEATLTPQQMADLLAFLQQPR